MILVQAYEELRLKEIGLYHLICLALMGSSLACSSRSQIELEQKKSQRVFNMEPLLIQAGQEEVLQPMELFQDGVGALQAQEYPRCIDRLEKLLVHFPAHSTRSFAHYNLGLCYELAGRFQEAVIQFDHYIEGAKQAQLKEDQLDGEFRLGFNLTMSSQNQRAIALYDRLLTTESIIGFDRSECHLRRAIAHLHLQLFAKADRDLSLAISHINGAIGMNRQGNELLAEVHFYRGEVYRLHMKHIKLKMPLDRMKRLFADKILFFRKSLYAYVDCLNVRHVFWGIAGGHQLGKLHEELYEDIVWAEIPPEFDQETEAYYRFELEKKLAPLLRESIHLYEKTMTLSVTHGLNNEWVSSTQEGLSRLRKLEEGVARRLTMDPLDAHALRPSLQEIMGPPPLIEAPTTSQPQYKEENADDTANHQR